MKRNPSVGTEPRPEDWNWPPDIFWISPDGTVIEVIGHLTAIQAKPRTFGLERSPVSKKEIDAVFLDLWSRGWVRGRFSDGKFSFQMERPRGDSVAAAFDLVMKFKNHTKWVDVDFSDPQYGRMSTEMKAQRFLGRKFPTSWGLNPRGRKP